mmetsp:Transcript_105042/g.186092  ORF Transcript_105042/g.186092 Transcript_105042/m.186092 type:complete len:432 (-) Transcript_105042:18-1313(-)
MAEASLLLAGILIVSLFFIWGTANSLNDILIKQFSVAFDLSDMQAGFVQSAFYAGYFFGALPAASFVRSYGYKAAVILGLCLSSVGTSLFYPFSLNGGWYLGFLMSLYLVAIGLAFLETSANVWVVVLGDLERKDFGTQALNIAQSFNPLGCLAGVLLGRVYILSDESPEHIAQMSPAELVAYREHEAAQVGKPYLFLAMVIALMAVIIALNSFPTTSQDEQQQFSYTQFRLSISRLWQNGVFLFGVIAQFFYVGGQVCVWSYAIRFVQAAKPDVSDQSAGDCLVVSFVIFMAGRFVASGLMTYIQTNHLLVFFACLASTTCVMAATLGGIASIIALWAISFFMSMCFSTIFGLTVSKVAPEDMPVGGSLLVMSIIGGAVLTPLMGALSDATSIATAYVLPACCFLVVVSFALAYPVDSEASERTPLLQPL